MPSLREIKDRIGSVRSTLKITSAMKLVASSKLRKAQRAIESIRPYESMLNDVMSSLLRDLASAKGASPARETDSVDTDFQTDSIKAPTAVVVISSNSSLCGGFNANVLRKAAEVIRQEEESGAKVKVFAIGRRAADTLRKAGYASEADYSGIVGHPSYDASTGLSENLIERFNGGEFGKVLLVYNHFVSSATQAQVVEQYLPFEPEKVSGESVSAAEDYIVEPSAEEVLEALMPQVMALKFHAAVLDSAAAEHAARTIAMQTATDNAQELLSDLTLEYNKGRQQKITAEILDLLGGSMN